MEMMEKKLKLRAKIGDYESRMELISWKSSPSDIPPYMKTELAKLKKELAKLK